MKLSKGFLLLLWGEIMKNTFGSSVSLTVFGESHGKAIGAVLDGLAPGIKIDQDYIAAKCHREGHTVKFQLHATKRTR